MEIISGITQFHIEDGTVVTCGKFDGIHMGHMKLINHAAKVARENNLKLCVFTFDVLPAVAFSTYDASQLTTNAERRVMFAEAGVDFLVEFPFNRDTATMAPEDFVRKVLCDAINARYIVIGQDWHFGKDRGGNWELLVSMGEECGFKVEVVDKEYYNDRIISSTWIREELKSGSMENVNILLGYPYTIQGEVEYGKQLGSKLGFPTANIKPLPGKLLPPRGVYSTRILIDGKMKYGVTNIGIRPTVDDSSNISVETFMFDFEENIYGKKIAVQLLHFQRPEMKFDSVEKLIAQVEADKEFAKTFFLL